MHADNTLLVLLLLLVLLTAGCCCYRVFCGRPTSTLEQQGFQQLGGGASAFQQLGNAGYGSHADHLQQQQRQQHQHQHQHQQYQQQQYQQPPTTPPRDPRTPVGGEVYYSEHELPPQASSVMSSGPSQPRWPIDKAPPPLGHPRTPTEMRRGATEMTLGFAPDAARDFRSGVAPAQYQAAGPSSLGSPAPPQPQNRAEILFAQLAQRTAPFEPSRVFEDWDANRDARLSREEFQKVAVRWLGSQVMMGDIDALFNALDADRNGTISRFEFVSALQAHRY